MPYKITVRDTADSDVQRIYNYYEEISTGLGERFLDKLQAAFDSLSKHPTNFSYINNKKVIRDLLKKFPLYSHLQSCRG